MSQKVGEKNTEQISRKHDRKIKVNRESNEIQNNNNNAWHDREG